MISVRNLQEQEGQRIWVEKNTTALPNGKEDAQEI